MAAHESDNLNDHHDEDSDLAFGMAVMKGALVGLPLMVILVSGAVWFIIDQDVGTSIITGLLPGVLFGVFGGGFVGVIRAMDH